MHKFLCTLSFFVLISCFASLQAQQNPQDKISADIKAYTIKLKGLVEKVIGEYSKLEGFMNAKDKVQMKTQLATLTSTAKYSLASAYLEEAYKGEDFYRPATTKFLSFFSNACENELKVMVGLYEKAYPTTEDEKLLKETYDTFIAKANQLRDAMDAEEKNLYVRYWAKPYNQTICEALTKALAEAPDGFQKLKVSGQSGSSVPCSLPMPGASSCSVESGAQPSLVYNFVRTSKLEEANNMFQVFYLYLKSCTLTDISFEEKLPETVDASHPMLLNFVKNGKVIGSFALKKESSDYSLTLRLLKVQ